MFFKFLCIKNMFKDKGQTRKLSVIYLRELDSLIHKKLYKLIRKRSNPKNGQRMCIYEL